MTYGAIFKMKKYILCITILSSLYVGCIKKFKYTVKVCDDNLYVERFNINPAGVDADYLTDSLNFRLYVGKWDNEHENFNYTCTGDSVLIKKLGIIDTTGEFQIIEKRVYSLQELKKKKMFE